MEKSYSIKNSCFNYPVRPTLYILCFWWIFICASGAWRDIFKWITSSLYPFIGSNVFFGKDFNQTNLWSNFNFSRIGFSSTGCKWQCHTEYLERRHSFFYKCDFLFWLPYSLTALEYINDGCSFL